MLQAVRLDQLDCAQHSEKGQAGWMRKRSVNVVGGEVEVRLLLVLLSVCFGNGGCMQ
jgi:hypothetical protein